MHEGEQHRADCCPPGPAVVGEEVRKLREGDLRKAALSHVAHHDYRDNYLVRRKSQNERHEYHPVHSQPARERVEESRADIQQSAPVNGIIREHPYHRPGRRRPRHSPAQDEQPAVQ